MGPKIKGLLQTLREAYAMIHFNKRKASGGSNPFEFVRSHRHNCHPILHCFFCVSSLSPVPPFSHLSHLFLRELKRHFATVLEKNNNIFFILDCSFLFFCYKPFKHLRMIIVVVESISK